MAVPLQVVVASPGAEPADVELMDVGLRRELADLGAEVAPVTGAAPAGTRSGQWLAVGQFLVSVVATGPSLVSIVDTVRRWLAHRSDGATVRLEIDGDVLEVGAATPEQQARLIEVWLARHEATP